MFFPPKMLLPASLLLCLASAARVEVSLDFGVRFSPAASSGACPPNAFPIDLSTVQCQNLQHMPAGDQTAAACAAAACALADVWQFSASQGCWIGPLSDCEGAPAASGWQGAGRNSSAPGYAPPQALPAYDDSAWALVDTPHDATILNNYNNQSNGGQAYLPPAVSWYRKRFRIPQALAGQVVTLVLDGALSTSSFYLNGVQLVANKANGYLPLVLRLDNAGLLLNGATNVLAAFVDGSETTGCPCHPHCHSPGC